MYPEFGNYQAIILTGGTTYSGDTLGNGITAATVNRLYCVSAGTLTITMMGGGTFTTPSMNPKEELFVIPSRIVVNSGSFVGFKPKRTWGNQNFTPTNNQQ